MSTLADASTEPRCRRLGVLAFRGPDAAKFLQGQLSADIGEARSRREHARRPAQSAGSRDRHPVGLAHLTRGVPARCCRASWSPAWRSGCANTCCAPGAHRRGCRCGERLPTSDLDDVRQGLPQVYAATSEQFVAQMLNLDLLGAIAFRQGLLYRPGSHRQGSLPRPREAPHAALAQRERHRTEARRQCAWARRPSAHRGARGARRIRPGAAGGRHFRRRRTPAPRRRRRLSRA